jgi:hypothetical protein
MYGVYKLNNKMSNANSVPLDILKRVSRTNSLQESISDADEQIKEICENCELLEKKWNTSKSIYKIIEGCCLFLNMILSLACVSLSVIYFSKFNSIFNFLNEKNQLALSFLVYYPYFYICFEVVSFVVDIGRFIGDIHIFKLFRYENKQKNLIERKIIRTDDFLINQSQNNKTMHIILNLKLRNKMRKKFKILIRYLIWIEIVVYSYFFFIVFLNKISTATYFKLSIMPKIECSIDSLSIQNINLFDCCNMIQKTENLTLLMDCVNYDDWSDCVRTSIDYYLNLLIALFYSTSVFKFILQSIFIINLKFVLINNFVDKHSSKEENLNFRYEKCQVYLFSKSVQERIDHNAKELAANLEKFKNEKTTLKKKKDSIKGNKNKTGNQQNNAGNIHQVAYYSNDQDY